MNRRISLIVIVLMLSACGTSPLSKESNTAQTDASGGEKAITAAEVTSVPESTPFLTLYNGSNLSTHSPARVHFETQADLDLFINEHPGAVSDRFSSSDPGLAIVSSPSSPVPVYGKVDFDKYEAILYQGRPFNLTDTARVISIEEQSDRLVVYTARWLRRTETPEAAESKSFAHLVAFPRTNKPVVFAPTMVVTSGTKATSGSGNAGPRWRAVPNPELTREKVEALVRRRLGSEPRSFSLERRTLQWIADNLQTGRGTLGNLSSNSEMWVAIAEGQFDPGAFGGPIGIGMAQPTGFSRVIYSISIEDGRILGISAKPL